MTTPTDRFLTGSSTGSFSTQSQHRFPVPSPTGTGTGATGSSTGTEPVEPLDPNPVNHHPKEHPLVITTLADLRRLTSTSQDGCWVWSGPIDKDGYGRWPDRHPDTVLAHRIAFILANGPVPSELEVDHTCRVRACCNPEHLEAVTHAENMRRTRGLGARAQRETCHRGHPYDESNTHRDRDGHRVCRKCQVIRTQQYRARRAS